MRVIFLFLSSYWLCFVNSAFAENDNSEDELEVIEVTSLKRVQNLQQTPVAVTAFSEHKLESLKLNQILGLANHTPSLSIGQFNLAQPQIYIRGIGSNEEGPGGDQSVAVFIDEVYIGRPSASDFDLFELERIEVLKGPQGTLFGKNTTGGAIHIITKKPESDFTTKFSLDLGNYNFYAAKGLITGPIEEDVSASLSFNTSARDGYIKNLVTDNYIQDAQNDSLRLAFNYSPSDDTEVYLSVDTSNNLTTDSGRKPNGGALMAHNYTVYPKLASDHFVAAAKIDGVQDRAIVGSHLNLSHSQFGHQFNLILAWRDLDWYQESDVLGTAPNAPISVINFVNENAEQSSIELRISSENSVLLDHYLLGIYYMNEDIRRIEEFQFNNAPFDVADIYGLTTNAAIYGHANYSLLDNLSLNIGLRYSKDDKERKAFSVPVVVIREFYDFSTSNSWYSTTYKYGLDYQISKSDFAYASVSTGFKSGGYAGQPTNYLAAFEPFKPEESVSYEIGYKAHFFDNRLRSNVAIFSADFTNYQELLVKADPVTQLPYTTTANAAEVKSQGVEVEIEWQVYDLWKLNTNISLLDATYVKYIGNEQLIGNNTRNAPETTYSVISTLDLEESLSVIWYLDWSYQSIAYQDPENNEQYAIPEYQLLNSNLVYLVDDNIEASFWIKNGLDEEYLLHRFPLTLTGDGPGVSAIGLNYGLGIKYEWF